MFFGSCFVLEMTLSDCDFSVLLLLAFYGDLNSIPMPSSLYLGFARAYSFAYEIGVAATIIFRNLTSAVTWTTLQQLVLMGKARINGPNWASGQGTSLQQWYVM